MAKPKSPVVGLTPIETALFAFAKFRDHDDLIGTGDDEPDGEEWGILALAAAVVSIAQSLESLSAALDTSRVLDR